MPERVKNNLALIARLIILTEARQFKSQVLMLKGEVNSKISNFLRFYKISLYGKNHYLIILIFYPPQFLNLPSLSYKN